MQIYNHDNYHITDILKDAYPAIKREYMLWNKFCNKPEYRGTASGPGQVLSGTWNTLNVVSRNKISVWRQWFFPNTCKLIKQIPVYENMRFSILGPGTELVAHTGWGDHFALAHLGIDCNEDSCLVVGDQEVREKNGEVIIFDDHCPHWAYNRGNAERIVLIFDILKTDLNKSLKK